MTEEVNRSLTGGTTTSASTRMEPYDARPIFVVREPGQLSQAMTKAGHSVRDALLFTAVVVGAAAAGWWGHWYSQQLALRGAYSGQQLEATVTLPGKIEVEVGAIGTLQGETAGKRISWQKPDGLNAEVVDDKTLHVSSRKLGEYPVVGYSAVIINGEAVQTPMSTCVVRVVEAKE